MLTFRSTGQTAARSTRGTIPDKSSSHSCLVVRGSSHRPGAAWSRRPTGPIARPMGRAGRGRAFRLPPFTPPAPPRPGGGVRRCDKCLISPSWPAWPAIPPAGVGPRTAPAVEVLGFVAVTDADPLHEHNSAGRCTNTDGASKVFPRNLMIFHCSRAHKEMQNYEFSSPALSLFFTERSPTPGRPRHRSDQPAWRTLGK